MTVANASVEAVTWQRVNVIISGTLGPKAAAVPCDFFLRLLDPEATTDTIARFDSVTIDGDHFELRMNVMRALDLFPLETGEWKLYVHPQGREPIAARMADEMTLDPHSYGGLFGLRAGAYWVMPACNPVTRAFRLKVFARGTAAVSRGPFANVRPGTLLRALRNALYLGVYEFFRRTVRKNGRRILFTSDSRESLSGNLHVIHDRMVARGLDREYRLLESFKPSIQAKRGLLDKITFTRYLAIADVVLCDDYQPMLYKVDYDPGVKVIQVWHASGAFKTVGYSRAGKPGGPNPFSAQHKSYTHAIVSSEHDIPFYAEAFGIPESRVLPTGIPRMDVFFDEEHKARTVARVHESIPETKSREVILFAPTFRGVGPSDAFYNNELIDFDGLYELCVERDAVVIMKMHPFVIEPPVVPERYRDRLLDATAEREINDILLVADLVITDYSSVVFEYSTLNRPMLFFAYDLDDYVATRDFYEEFTSFVPGKIVRTFDELLKAIREQDFEFEKVDAFAHEHFSHLDGGSTDRVIDELILGKE